MYIFVFTVTFRLSVATAVRSLMARLNVEEFQHAQRLCDMVCKVNCVRIRIDEMTTSHRLSDDRNIVVFENMPRISIKDLEANHDLISLFIDFNKDVMIKKAAFMEFVWKCIDKRHFHKLSMQSLVLLQDSFARWEGDKCRLLWSYFTRMYERSAYSSSILVWRLKEQMRCRKADFLSLLEGGSARGGEPSDPDPQARSPLEDLPEFPELEMDSALEDLPEFPELEMDCSHEDLEMESSPRLSDSGMEEALIEILSSDEDKPAAAPIASPEEHTSAGLIPIGGADIPDSYLPYPQGFDDPLPSSLEVGLPPVGRRNRQRPEGPKDIEALKELLVSKPSINVKEHIKAVRQQACVLKRPASALPAPSAKERKTAATAVETVAPAEQQFRDHLAKCIKVCEDSPTEHQRGKVVCSWQREQWIFQVKCLDTKRMVVMLSSKQFASKAKAEEGINVLCELFKMGASKKDLQRCKVHGCLFGVKHGKPVK